MSRYSPEFLAAIRHAYVDTDQAMTAIAGDFGIGITTLQSLIRKQGWPQRSKRTVDSPAAVRLLEEAQALVQQAPAHSRASGNPDLVIHPEADSEKEPGPRLRGDERPVHAEAAIAPSASTLTPVERLEALVVRELEAEEAARAELALRPRTRNEAERCARTLSVLTQTLQTLQRMRGGQGGGAVDDYDDIPEDPDAFREALAQKIEAFLASRPEEGLEDPADGNAAE